MWCGLIVEYQDSNKITIPFPSPVSLTSPTSADCGEVACDSPTACSWMLTFLGEESSSYESNTKQLVTQIWPVNVHALSYLAQTAFLEPSWPSSAEAAENSDSTRLKRGYGFPEMNYGFQSLGLRISEANISRMTRSLAFLSQSVKDGSRDVLPGKCAINNQNFLTGTGSSSGGSSMHSLFL